MRILTFTDLHADKQFLGSKKGNKSNLKIIKEKALKHKPDIIIDCGDMSLFGQGLDKVAHFLNKLNIKVLTIPGNHESPEQIEEISKKYKNIINLHKRAFEYKGFAFFGWGTGGFAKKEIDFEKVAKKFKKAHNKKKKLILITHTTIYNTKTDYLGKELGHVGCKSIRDFIEEVQPVLVLCGHLHETFRKKDKIKNTLILNPGSDGMIVELK